MPTAEARPVAEARPGFLYGRITTADVVAPDDFPHHAILRWPGFGGCACATPW